MSMVDVAESNEGEARPPVSDFQALMSMGTATVHEVVNGSSVLPAAIVPIVAGAAMCGPAFTVDAGPGDNLWIHRAIYRAPADAILVVSCGGAYEYGYWGEILSTAASERGLGGVLIDGDVRDVEALQAVGFPVFARGLCVRGTGKHPRETSGVGQVLSIGVATIAPGDVIVGDSDGVIALPAGAMKDARTAAARRLSREQTVLDGLRAGATSLDSRAG